MRRLNIVVRCIDNIFELFPPNNDSQLSADQRNDLCINLHSFFINIAGILDNIAWVIAFEHGLYIDTKGNRKMNRGEIGLFGKSKLRKHIPYGLKKYLDQKEIKEWYTNYSKNFRDALAHRIPLYVPPAVLSEGEAREYQALDEQFQTLDLSTSEGIEEWGKILDAQKGLGIAQPFFTHSTHIDEGGSTVYLHPQVLSDFETIKALIEMLIDCEITRPQPNTDEGLSGSINDNFTNPQQPE
jgi:hypothetical protein